MNDKLIKLDLDFDFGFSTISDDDMELDRMAAAAEGQAKAEMMYKMIMPLLNNLAKDADKNAYIHWPNRAAKITEFKEKLEEILNS